jgi:hypothetical protein
MRLMRTTLTIDDQLLAELNERALRQNGPLRQVVNQVLRRGLQPDTPQGPRKPFRAKTFTMGQPLVPSLDKSLALAAALEDEEIARKLALRK